MWAYESVFYHIYPIGLCGAPRQNALAGEPVSRILKVNGWIEHIKSTGANAVFFGPVFESMSHGYDTVDYKTIDRRLGTNDDFAAVCKNLHDNGLKVIVDAVLDHVGRDFWAFKDVRERKWSSPYKDWFTVDFNSNSGYNDGFWYKGWEGHYELVALNLQNPEVKQYLFDCVMQWAQLYAIDGLRLDVAYCLDRQFLSELRGVAGGISPEFFLLGETLHGDYNQWCSDGMCHSVTNYECYKGLYSSFNDLNMFEIAHSLSRQFGPEDWTLYKGKHLFSFLDNHDVTRIASILKDKRQLRNAYTLLFAMPGIPAVYYGSEWGAEGFKHDGDDGLRPEFEAPEFNELTSHIAKLAAYKTSSEALNYGNITQLVLTNRQYAFMRECGGKRVVAVINADSNGFHFDLSRAGGGMGRDVLSGDRVDALRGVDIGPYASMLIELI